MQKSVDILLVEDDARNAELVLEALRQSHIPSDVAHVVDGHEAMDFISRSELYVNWQALHVPRVILLNLDLTTVNGLDVLRQLRAEDNTRTIPVVVFTGSQRDIDVIESYHLGVNSYVLKPAEAGKFLQIVVEIANYWVKVNHPPAH
jgi:CheY-like chemotaxis protein